MIHSRQPVALNWARNSFGLVLTVFLRKICILGIAEYFLIVLFQISEIKKDEIRFKKYIFLLDMFLIVGGGRVPVTGMLAGMNLSKPGINLSKPGMNLSKPGKKHRNHVIMHTNLPSGPVSLPSYKQIMHVLMCAAWQSWYHPYLHDIDRQWERGNWIVSMLLHWYCQIVLCCDCMIKFVLTVSTFSGDITPCVYTRPDHLTQSTWFEVHITWVIPKVQTF